jgi:hypothetical protein
VRLPFPERFSLFHVAAFCLVLNVLQQMEGTSILFSACTTLFLLIATLAFNVAGGLAKPSGGWIFAYSLLVVMFGVAYKAFLGEPGQSNLLQPERTIEVYVAGASMMLLIAFLVRKLRPQRSLLPQFASLSDMGRAATMSFALGAALEIVPPLINFSSGPGSLYSAISQLNFFLPLALILGITYEIRRSEGRRSVNLVVWASGLLSFGVGVLGFSKQGMLVPLVIWIVVAASQRYKVSIAQITGIALAFAFIVYYLVPYSQYGRAFRIDGATFKENTKISILLLSNLDEVRTAYILDANSTAGREDSIQFYNRPQGFADRLQMISPDDALVNVTENGSVFGIFPTIFAFENLIPHALWPAKPIVNYGNIYAHEVGVIADDTDTTTGVSFSALGDAYHQAKWVGILVLLPGLLFTMFLLTDACCGDTRESPFSLLALTFFLHSAPEGGVNGVVHDSTFGIVSLLLASLLSTKLMPFLSKLVVSSDKEQQTGGRSIIQPQHGRFAIATAVQSGAEVPMSPYRWSRPGSRK